MKTIDKIKLGLHSIAFGMKGADDVISKQASYGSSEGANIIQEREYGGVFADMLQQKETQEVVEMRDKYYRVLREADKYVVDARVKINEETGVFDTDISASARKKTALDFNNDRLNIYNPENYEIRTIQEIKLILKNSSFDPSALFTSDQTVPNIEIERDGFEPRFRVENYAKKCVVRKRNDGKFILDFYTTSFASQFGKVDALYIAELNRIFTNKTMRSDTTSFKSVDFYTDKAYGVEDMLHFRFENITFKSIDVFDGNFVLSFVCDCMSDGEDMVAKYRTKELDEKYEQRAPKNNPDINAVARRLEEVESDDDFTTTTLKIS